MLLSFIYYQRQSVIHFKSDSHWWAWGDCVVVSELFSTSMCHSFQKRGSPLGFLVSACLQRLVGWLRFFRLNFSLIINLFNFFNSSMARTHASIFQCVGFEPGALRGRAWHAYLSPTRCHSIANASFTLFLRMQKDTLHLGRKNTLLRAQIAGFARRLFLERVRKNTLLRAQKDLFAPVTKVG